MNSPPARRFAALRAALTMATSPGNGLLPAAGIALGLLCAGLAMFRSVEPRVTVVPPGYVALVNQKGVLQSDFMAQTAAENGKPFEETTAAERAIVLREMIEEELFTQRALLLDLPETTVEVRNALVAAARAQVSAPALEQEPTDSELRTFHAQNRARYTADGAMTLRDLVLHVGGYQNANQTIAQAMIDATEAAYQLRSGATIDHIVEHFGFVDSGLDKDSMPDFAARIRLGERLFQAAANLADGAVSDPVQEAGALHLLVMQRRVPAQPAEFNSVRSKVYDDYREEQRLIAQKQSLQILRGEAQILLAPGMSETP